jgi:RHS repeat-associated protein
MNGSFTPAQLVTPKPSLAGLGNEIQIMDLEGDGRKQWVHWQNEPKGFFELGDEETWKPFRPFRQFPNTSFADQDTRLIDLNGDGRADILITEDDVFTWYPSDGKKGFEPANKLARNYDDEKGPAVVFAEALQTIFLADMSGDGRTDIVRIRNGEICYWPNLGYGKFGAKVSMDGAPVFDHPDNFNPVFIKLADIDGSGTSDIVYLGRNNFTIWLNQNGNYFSSPKTIGTFPGINNLSEVSVFDLLGTGLACLVWNSSLLKDAAAPLRYIDLMASTKPHIMISYKNNLGKEVSLEYTPSTQFYVRDKLNGTPWITKLHFPVHCVSKVIARDRIMKTRLASTYSYHHGYYDHPEKEFRGFGRVDQTDCEEADHFILKSPGISNIVEQDLNQFPVLTKTWFHTGAFLSKDLILNQFVHEYFQNPALENQLPEPSLPQRLTIDEWREALRACKGMALRKEIYGKDKSVLENIPYSAEQHNSLIKILQPRGTNKYAVCLVNDSESISYHYERNATDPRVAHEFIFAVDNYANVLSSASVVYPRAGTPDSVDTLVVSEQQKIHILFHQFAYTNAIINDTDSYRTPLLYSSKTYELTVLPGPDALQEFASPLRVPYYNLQKLYSYCSTVFPSSSTDSGAGTLIAYDRTLYCPDTDSSVSLGAGIMDTKALVFESYKAVFTQGMLADLNIPGFSLTSIDALLKDPTRGAFVYEDNYYLLPSGRKNYDVSHFFLSTAYTDPFGNITTIQYDPNYYLFVLSVTDALSNTVSTTGFNYRTLSPYLMTDINGNRSGVRFDEVGVVVNTFLMGKQDENKGDFLDIATSEINGSDQPGSVMEYEISQWYDQSMVAGFDITAYYKPQPNYVHAKSRTAHYYADGGMVNTNPVVWLEAYSYSDGGGHEILKKVQADPGEALQVNSTGNIASVKNDTRWIGNGRTILNNKGNAVKKYEPYFSTGFNYDDEKEMVELGVTAILHYDAPGRAIRTDLPDGSFSKIEFDPWKQLTYDQNDTVIDSTWYKNLNPDLSLPEPSDPKLRTAWLAAQDYNTPVTVFFDTLGRTIISQQPLTTTTGFLTKSILDIQGNVLRVIDANNNTVMSYQYDMLKHPLYQNSMDAGQRWALNNAFNKPLMKWDERNHIFSFSYDELMRPNGSGVTGGDGIKPLNNLYEKIVYDETLGTTVAQAQNLLGKPHLQYDQAGQIINNNFDFKGNPISSSRVFASDYKNLPDWNNPFPDSLLDTTETFVRSFIYDALNRIISLTTPDESITSHTYNPTSLLKTVNVAQKGSAVKTFVQNIDYDAKGQRNSILYGNNAQTTYQYDVNTFRLIRLITKDSSGNSLQDLSYFYDPVGNILQQTDACIPTVFFKNYEVNGITLYEYDALYRLISASGREHAGLLTYGPADNWNDVPFAASYSPNDNLAWQNYIQNFAYDPAGNIKQLAHSVGGGSGWTRNYNYENTNNRLKNTTVGTFNYPYTYHPKHGFMTSMPHLQVMNWNFKDELEAVAAQKVNAGTPETTWYVYDAAGRRVRKITENSSGTGVAPTRKCERIYTGGIEIFRQYTGTNAGLLRQTLHVMDDTRRIAMIETRNAIDDGTEPILIRYQFANHLGSSSLELDDTTNIISYEEYHPYGTTSYQAMNASVKAAAKRYRYTGMERDEESGLEYHTARYYITWIGRWSSPDPSGIKDQPNLYQYVRNCPVKFIDENGKDPIVGTPSGVNLNNPASPNLGDPLTFPSPSPKTPFDAPGFGPESFKNPFIEPVPTESIPVEAPGAIGTTPLSAPSNTETVLAIFGEVASSAAIILSLGALIPGDSSVKPASHKSEESVTNKFEYTAPTAKQFLTTVANSDKIEVFRNLSPEIIKYLVSNFGSGLAEGLNNKGTIASYEALKEAVANLGGFYQAHHIVEAKILKIFGFDTEKAPAVVLTSLEHSNISKKLEQFLPAAELEHMSKKQILSGYEKAYEGHPEWLNEVKRYFK